MAVRVEPRIGRAAGVLSALSAALAILYSALNHPGFSPTRDVASVLGTGATAAVFNNGLLLSAALGFVFSVSLALSLAGRGRLYAGLLALSSLSLAGVALFPLPQPLHPFAALAVFLLSALGTAGLGWEVFVSPLWLRLLSFLVTVTGLLTMLQPRALEEVAFIASLVLWMFLVSLRLTSLAAGGKA